MGRSAPSRAISRVWLASPTTLPSSKIRATGFSTVSRVSSCSTINEAEAFIGADLVLRPYADAAEQAVEILARDDFE